MSMPARSKSCSLSGLEAGIEIVHRRVQLRHAGVDQHARIRMVDDVYVDRHPLALGEQVGNADRRDRDRGGGVHLVPIAAAVVVRCRAIQDSSCIGSLERRHPTRGGRLRSPRLSYTGIRWWLAETEELEQSAPTTTSRLGAHPGQCTSRGPSVSPGNDTASVAIVGTHPSPAYSQAPSHWGDGRFRLPSLLGLNAGEPPRMAPRQSVCRTAP